MDNQYSLNNLLYIEEHRSCRNYLETIENGFKYIEFAYDEIMLDKESLWNYLLFVIDGECIIDCNQFRGRLFRAGTIVLLPKKAMVTIKASAGTRLLSLSFSVPLNVCDKFILQSLSGICENIEYDFQPLDIRYPLPPYMEVVTHCLNNKMACGHFHELLEQELFFILRGFYLKEELALLFYPIVSAELSFKDFVINSYLKVSNVNELVSLSNMGKSSFYKKFRKAFGMSAKQWLLKQQDIHIINKIATSETTVGKLMEEFKFESQAHFTNYCKQRFNCTPRELIIKYQAVDQ